MRRTCDVNNCRLPFVQVLRWPWTHYAFRACAEHNQGLVAGGMVVHEDGARMVLALHDKGRF